MVFKFSKLDRNDVIKQLLNAYQVTKEEYEADLDKNIVGLVARLKRKAYRPQPARRTYIRKTGTDKMMPLSIPAYEDKIIKMGSSKILSAIYEADFQDCS